jgi:tetratricopeptide (TPR) repeat protein
MRGKDAICSVLFFLSFIISLPTVSHSQSTIAEASALDERAVRLYHSGKPDEAILLARKALSIYENVLGPTNPNVGTSLSNLASFYRSQGRYAEAEPLYKRALAIHEKAFGPNDHIVGVDVGNLAGLLESQGRYSDAEPLYKRALEIVEKTRPVNPAEVAAVLNNLAHFYVSQDRYGDAEPIYKRAIDIFKSAFGSPGFGPMPEQSWCSLSRTSSIRGS